MKFRAVSFAILLFMGVPARAAEQPVKGDGTRVFPMALDRDFEFRKTKLYLLDPNPPRAKPSKLRSTTKTDNGPNAMIDFERSYRAYGAVNGLEIRHRYGHYYDFFWRAKRDAPVTVRLEYRQEKLRAFVQAREVFYPHALGANETEFRITGDDFFDDGKIISWRCLLIENGRIVAENRSYMWE